MVETQGNLRFTILDHRKVWMIELSLLCTIRSEIIKDLFMYLFLKIIAILYDAGLFKK